MEITEKKDTFDILIDQIKATHAAKNSDYGNSFEKSVDRFGPVAFFVRASDKFNRAENLLINEKEVKVKDESVEDTLLDLASYCVLMVEYLKHKKE